ncbi:MAG TPA: hypothetical protein VLB44_17015 [Kofleriaceae bacterium]|nr:hypothetical protein [Kofleriaceae bacterium]
MRGLVIVIGVALAGCNQIFGLSDTILRDGSTSGDDGGGGNVDARPIVPPDGTTSCGGVPDFEAWTYTARTLSGFSQSIGTFGVYAGSNGEHMIVTPLDGSSIWDVDLVAGSSMPIAGLMPPSGKAIMSVATCPDGAAVWFKIDAASYVALRATGFVRQQTELGLPNAYEVLPGAVAYYAGELRMVARVRDTSSSQTAYVELSSTDGITWTRGATLPFGGAGYYAAALSADGCTLTFSHQDTGSTIVPYRASRDSSGVFGTPVKLTLASTVASTVFNPTLSPNNLGVWMTVIGGSSPLYRGQP